MTRALTILFVVSLIALPPRAFAADEQSTADALSASDATAREQLHAVLWMQQAAEYRVLVQQTYRLATERLATADQPGSAALEQDAVPAHQLASLPPAIILDLDETVLDNSYFQARMLRDRVNYSDPLWDAWVQEASAPAMPGAREYLEAAAQRGVRIFYVTNRECPKVVLAGGDPCPAKTATQRNLIRLGLPGAADPANLLLRRERPEWAGRSKSARRAWIGERYRIIALVGDDMGDFVDRQTHAARRGELAPLFGTRWFLLPNAMYGSWERAVAEPACPPGTDEKDCPALVVARKYALLETDPPPIEPDPPRVWDPATRALRLATWNVEYLVEPHTYAALAPGCVADGGKVSGADRRLPCAVVPRLDRDAEDFAALRRYAAQIDGDVIALQEVDGPGTAERLFPGFQFCFSSRLNVQNNGFAIRRGLPFRCEADYLPLSLGDTVRRGVVVTLFPGTASEVTVMNVHLKSGCPVEPLTDTKIEACATLARQLGPLEDWIDAQARAGRRFALLGDFNRRMLIERGGARDAQGRQLNVWAEINDGEPAGASLVDVTRGAKFTKCIADDPYDQYIDTVLLDRKLAASILPKSFIRVTFTLDDAKRHALSDHCPVGIALRVQ